MTKYIHLYEDYTEIGEKGLPKSHGWSDIRDSINLKKPFMVIDFKDEDGKDQCVSSELHKMDYSDQSHYVKDMSGNTVESPSIFVFCSDFDISKLAASFLKRFNIRKIIVGEPGDKHTKLHVDDDPITFASDIMTGISPDDMGGDNYYKNGSTYYKFIN